MRRRAREKTTPAPTGAHEKGRVMARRKTDSKNWGGRRPNSGKRSQYGEPLVPLVVQVPGTWMAELRRRAEANDTSVSHEARVLLEPDLAAARA